MRRAHVYMTTPSHLSSVSSFLSCLTCVTFVTLVRLWPVTSPHRFRAAHAVRPINPRRATASAHAEHPLIIQRGQLARWCDPRFEREVFKAYEKEEDRNVCSKTNRMFHDTTSENGPGMSGGDHHGHPDML